PVNKPTLMELVKRAGLDVRDWGNSARGVSRAASNPKYCYEWCFRQNRLVIVNLWFARLRRRSGRIVWLSDVSTGRDVPKLVKAVWQRRGQRLYSALQEAARRGLPVRVVIQDGRLRDPNDRLFRPASVRTRMLDPLTWAVTRLDRSGRVTLTR